MGRMIRITGRQEADFSTWFFTAEHQQSTTSSKEATGELDDSPVYRAIARHLGTDISAEGRAARNRRGIVVIVHGAPLTGTGTVALGCKKGGKQERHILVDRGAWLSS